MSRTVPLTPAPVSWRMPSAWSLLAKVLRMFMCQCWPQDIVLKSEYGSGVPGSYQLLLSVPYGSNAYNLLWRWGKEDPVIYQVEPRCALELFSEHTDRTIHWWLMWPVPRKKASGWSGGPQKYLISERCNLKDGRHPGQ